MAKHIILIILLIIMVLIMLYLFCIAPKLPRRHMPAAYSKFEYAHRGFHNIGHGVAENSIPAFRRAVEKGYAIELDLHRTMDGQVVVFHDDNLRRICGIDKPIWTYTYDGLRDLRLQGTTELIPLLTDVLSLVDGKVPLLIELKLPTRDMTLCKDTLRILRGYSGPFMIQSFNTFGLLWFRRHAPDILRGQLSSNLTMERRHLMPRAAFIPCFLAKYLLCNVIGRPDFISYRYTASHNLSFWLDRKLFRSPSAVWTIRGEKLRSRLASHYDILIIEDEPAGFVNI